MKALATLFGSTLLMFATAGYAATPDARQPSFDGVDISGVYACVGNDVHDGDTHSTMTVTLDRKYSVGRSGSYKVTVDDVYTGSIVSDGKQLAMDFANKDPSKNDYGVALAYCTALMVLMSAAIALIQWAVGLRAAVSISSERERGTWDALMTSPLDARAIGTPADFDSVIKEFSA